MKGILVLLVLLKVHTSEVCSEPYPASSDGTCLNSKTEYQLDGSNLCCKKCQPGHRLKQECHENTETLCEKCPKGQYMEGMNYSPNCLSCNSCKSAKGLQYLQNCSSTTRSKCGCQPGMYCIMHFDDPYCAACNKYRLCNAGYGVSRPGTADSDVKCERCPNGTFSDTVSYTDRCRPHTSCREGVVVRKGNATTDTLCQPEAIIPNIQTPIKEPHTEAGVTTASATVNTVSDSKAPHGPTDSTLSVSLFVSAAVFNHSTKSPTSNKTYDSTLAAVVVCAIGVLLLIAISLLLYWKIIWKKGSAKLDLKVDANGNCMTGDKINQDYLGEAQVISLTVTSPEQQCLLEKGEACSDQSQNSYNTETLTRTDDCSSYESISPPQSTIALHSSRSALSEPMTLLSNAEPAPPQTSIPTQPSSQPTSPQIISPVTSSPHVNVNITVHIGHSSVGTPCVTPTDLGQADYHIPIGEEEESFSIPQQEAGKQSLMAVQESASYSI